MPPAAPKRALVWGGVTVHLYFDNQLVYMSYTLHQDLPVQAGFTYSMYAEWFAADHFPFSPRDVTRPVISRVASS